MTFFQNFNTKSLSLNQIDFENNEFKISKPLADDRLGQSIQSFGILEPPVLSKDNGLYKIILGHNRLFVLKEMDTAESGKDVICNIVDELNPDVFIRQAILKNFRGEVGPVGKSRFIHILRKKFCLEEKLVNQAAKNIQIPDDFINPEQIENILLIPEPLKNFLDIKDIGFKIIKKILRLSDNARIFISDWVTMADIRVNIFKSIIDLVSDINKKDKMLSGLNRIDFTSTDSTELSKSTGRKDEILYRELFNRRYPEYSEIKLKVDSIISNLVKNGIAVDFPKYFEKDEIGVLLKISKRDNIEGFRKKLDQVDLDSLEKLLNLL